MKRTFEITKSIIIDYIQSFNTEYYPKLNIKISCGNINRIIKDRIFFENNGKFYNVGIEGFKKDDLIIVLRYLEILEKSRNIMKTQSRIGETWNKKFKRWERRILNEKHVDSKIREYLNKKKNIAIVDNNRVLKEDLIIRSCGNFIKNRLLELKRDFNKNSDIFYDIKNKMFIIVIDKYGNSEFDINLLHLLNDVRCKFNKDFIVYSLHDYGKMYNSINQKILYF